MASPLVRAVYVALALGHATVLATSAASFFSVTDSVARSNWMNDTHQVRRQLVLLLSMHQDLDTGQARGQATFFCSVSLELMK